MITVNEDKIMEIGPYFNKTAVHKNCRNFFKRIYDLPVVVSKALVMKLSCFGDLELNEFSKIVPGSKDVFNIRRKDGMEVSGVIGENAIWYVIPKHVEPETDSFEILISDYVEKKLHSAS